MIHKEKMLNPLQIALHFLLLFLLLRSAALAQGSATAQGGDLQASTATETVVCEQDVYYAWKKVEQPKKGVPLAESSSSSSPAIDVFFTTLSQAAASSNEAKNKLQAQKAQNEGYALEYCKKKHEDQANCIASSLKASAANYNLMDFASRRTLLDAISKDCSNNSGNCLSVKSDQPRCYLHKAEAATEDATKKDTGKGGKKK